MLETTFISSSVHEVKNEDEISVQGKIHSSVLNNVLLLPLFCAALINEALYTG